MNRILTRALLVLATTLLLIVPDTSARAQCEEGALVCGVSNVITVPAASPTPYFEYSYTPVTNLSDQLALDACKQTNPDNINYCTQTYDGATTWVINDQKLVDPFATFCLEGVPCPPPASWVYVNCAVPLGAECDVATIIGTGTPGNIMGLSPGTFNFDFLSTPEEIIGNNLQLYASSGAEGVTISELSSVLPGFDLSPFHSDPNPSADLVYAFQTQVPFDALFTQVQVPEPTGLGLVVVGLGGLAVTRRRGRAAPERVC
jgi:hypothetical protein